jgi:predicted lipid-binding transport protein (Tim44 family)
MKTILIAFFITLFSLIVMTDAEAGKRFGGGKSSGMQRESTKDAASAAPRAAPTSPSAAPAANAPIGAAPAPATGMRKWLGPLAGLAAGGLIGAMLFGGGFAGIKFLDILLIGVLAFVAFKVFRHFAAKRAMAAGDGRGSGGNSGNSGNNGQFAGAGGAYNPSQPAQPAPHEMPRAAAPVSASGRIAAPEIGSRLSGGNASPSAIEAATINPRIPADFDVAPFQRQAHAAFIRLQTANDSKDLNDIRDFTTPEMYAEIALQLQERGDAKQKTDVATLAVTVLEVVTENNHAVASVRYTGTLRDTIAAVTESFDEVWHVTKSLSDTNATWRLAGIQQLD